MLQFKEHSLHVCMYVCMYEGVAVVCVNVLVSKWLG